MTSGRDLILSQAGKREIVPTSADGVYATTFSASCYAEYKRRQAKAWDAKRPHDCTRLLSEADAYLLIVGLCDKDGGKLFTESDFPALLTLPNGTFQSMLNAVVLLNSLDRLSLEDAEKKSDATSGDSSPTDSPSS